MGIRGPVCSAQRAQCCDVLQPLQLFKFCTGGYLTSNAPPDLDPSPFMYMNSKGPSPALGLQNGALQDRKRPGAVNVLFYAEQ